MPKYINTSATSALPLLSSWVPSMSYTAPTTLYDYWGMILRIAMILRMGMILWIGMILRMGTVMILVSFIYKMNIVTHVMMGTLNFEGWLR